MSQTMGYCESTLVRDIKERLKDQNHYRYWAHDMELLLKKVEELELDKIAIPVGHAELVRKAQTVIGKLTEALKIVDYADRSRGYPTPKEWDEVVRVARQALKDTAET